MPENNRRKIRLESLLRREIAACIQNELRDPRLGFITVTRVDLAPDYEVCTAYYTVLGEAKNRNLAAHALESARGYVQGQYSKVLQLRRVPKLSFHYDDLEVKRQAMDDIIRKARATDPHPPAPEDDVAVPPFPLPEPKPKVDEAEEE